MINLRTFPRGSRISSHRDHWETIRGIRTIYFRFLNLYWLRCRCRCLDEIFRVTTLKIRNNLDRSGDFLVELGLLRLVFDTKNAKKTLKSFECAGLKRAIKRLINSLKIQKKKKSPLIHT